MPRRSETPEQYRARLTLVGIKMLLRDIERACSRVVHGLRRIRTCLRTRIAALWHADTLLFIVAAICALAGAWILVQPAYPWGIGQ